MKRTQLKKYLNAEFFLVYFPRNRCELLGKSPYSIQTRKNTDQKN